MVKDGLYIFSSKTCRPCKELSSKLDDQKIDYVKIDVDDTNFDRYRKLLGNIEVEYVPAVYLVKNASIKHLKNFDEIKKEL